MKELFKYRIVDARAMDESIDERLPLARSPVGQCPPWMEFELLQKGRAMPAFPIEHIGARWVVVGDESDLDALIGKRPMQRLPGKHERLQQSICAEQ
ncbi:hypothetical protein WT90_20315 [Burkholderia stagnalis]|nr:hypothetical protein WT80_23835 [Burkholderia stagnalis]KWN71201.1 hypothetical protein WT90_20315 [Burkholderia stagnalis]